MRAASTVRNLLIALAIGLSLGEGAAVSAPPAAPPAPRPAAPAQHPAAPAQRPAATAPKVPEPAIVLIMVRSTLLAVDQGIRTGNFTVVRDLGAPIFRQS